MKSQLAMAELTRRDLLRAWGVIGSAGMAVSLGLGGFIQVAAQQTQLGMPQPDEKVEATINRLFGNRSIAPADGKVKLEAPLIAENGAVVPVTVQADLPMTPQEYVKSIYIIADKNRRPLNAKFSLTPEAGQATISTNIRLAQSTDLRAVVEMNHGALYMVKREVKVTVGGCGG
jgi:sulfur-oxidizing protein SoxY